jgi:hypothetical protein
MFALNGMAIKGEISIFNKKIMPIQAKVGTSVGINRKRGS